MAGSGAEIRRAREEAGLTQAALAERAAVSRQQVAALEAGRHVPGVDAALRLAAALGRSVEDLFGPAPAPPASLHGSPLPDGALVKLGRVGDRLVAVPLDDPASGGSAWASPDGVVVRGGVRTFAGAPTEGLVVAGCEPALGLAETLLRGRGGRRLVAVPATSGEALSALAAGRCHAAVVHGPSEALPAPPVAVRRRHLARWRVGLALPPRRGRASLEALLADGGEVFQREPSAASQQALIRALARLGLTDLPPGRLAAGHIDAARRTAITGRPAVTIEPAALAHGLAFRALETHAVELWLAEGWLEHPGIAALGDLLSGSAFRERVGALGGYDLDDCGRAVAA
jgi:transcriptional regulator with XRE-family HTH domain